LYSNTNLTGLGEQLPEFKVIQSTQLRQFVLSGPEQVLHHEEHLKH